MILTRKIGASYPVPYRYDIESLVDVRWLISTRTIFYSLFLSSILGGLSIALLSLPKGSIYE
jgi:hypothetical protein